MCALAAALCVLALLVIAPAAAQAGAGLGATTDFPATVTVGDTNLPASVLLTNANTLDDPSLTVCNVSDVGSCAGFEGITLLPSCGSAQFNCTGIGGPDPRVFNVDSPALGRTGTSCEGMAFSVTMVDAASGKVRLRPTDPATPNVVLPTPGSACRIDFTIDVLAFPRFDAKTAIPGLQTLQIIAADGASDNGGFANARGTSNGITVRGAPTIASTPSAGVNVGGKIKDTATLTGEYNPTAGNVTFDLYGPDDTDCSGPVAFTSTVPINMDGSATSPDFTTTKAGAYRWIARYGGDDNNDLANGTCPARPSVTVAKASPTIQSNASPTVAVGGTITDAATLTGEHNPTTGEVRFRAYGPGDPTCSGAIAFDRTVAIGNDGTVTSPGFVPATAGTYRWIASYAGDADNNAAGGVCDDANSTVVVSKVMPEIQNETSAAAIVIGGAVSDTVTLSGEHNPATGSVTFKLYGPVDAACTQTPKFTSTVDVGAGGTASSPAFTPTAPGTYRWTAEYAGDVNNQAAISACNAPTSTVVVSRAAPTLQSSATGPVVIGAVISNTATLGDEFNPTAGRVTFKLFAPGDTSCTGTPVSTTVVDAASDGTASSPSFTTTEPGTYRWTAGYGGDANNDPAAAACNSLNSTSSVSKASPSVQSTASAGVLLGGSITDTAVLTGEHNPTSGNVTFRLFGPGDTDCTTTPVLTAAVAISANGTATSPSFTPTAPGTYHWTAEYGGDGANNPATGACDLVNAAVTISKTAPSIQSNASPAVVIGAAITDSATLSGEHNPAGGSVTFRAFGPADANCAGAAVFTSTVAINTDGTATSGAFAPTAAGTYRWTTEYSGDAGNGSATGSCNAPNSVVTVSKASPTIATTASPSVKIGGAVNDTARLTGAHGPVGGSVTFRLYGPGDSSCATAPAFTSTVAANADATATSAGFTPAVAGTYRWTAEYSGDANNNAASGACNDPNETVVAGKASPSIATTPSGTVTLGGAITDTATLVGAHGPVSGSVTFKLYGPDDAKCAKAPVFSSTAQVGPDGRATAAPFTPTEAGSYRWVATYSGDVNNGAATGGCDASNAVIVEENVSPLLCGNKQIALVDVFPEGGRMIVTGVARPSLKGQKTKIVLQTTGGTAVSTIIGTSGTFSATAPLPAKKYQPRARYAALVKTHKSVALKLRRRSYMTRTVLAGDKLMLAGRVTGKFKPRAKVSINQITLCTKNKQIASTKLRSDGTWRVTLPAPANAASVLFRAKTTVLNGRKTEQTFTLPRPATLSAAR